MTDNGELSPEVQHHHSQGSLRFSDDTVRSQAKRNLVLTPLFGLPVKEKSPENLPAETEKIQLKNLKAQQKNFSKEATLTRG